MAYIYIVIPKTTKGSSWVVDTLMILYLLYFLLKIRIRVHVRTYINITLQVCIRKITSTQNVINVHLATTTTYSVAPSVRSVPRVTTVP